jgi:hypothetical protein
MSIFFAKPSSFATMGRFESRSTDPSLPRLRNKDLDMAIRTITVLSVSADNAGGQI